VRTVPEIIDAVKRLDEEQKNQFLAKLAEIDFEKIEMARFSVFGHLTIPRIDPI
jgi:hypothetical protein